MHIRLRDIFWVMVLGALLAPLGSALRAVISRQPRTPVSYKQQEPEFEPVRRELHGPVRPGETLGWTEAR